MTWCGLLLFFPPMLDGPQAVCILLHCPLLATKEITAALVYTSAACAIVSLWFTLHATSVKCSLEPLILFLSFTFHTFLTLLHNKQKQSKT